jgi:hypothetical protein
MSKRDNIVRATEDRAARPPLAGSVGVGKRSRQREVSPHALKFLVATTSLVVIAVIAVAVAVVTAHNATNAGPAPAWSSWSPPDGGLQGARDIADHLAPFYRVSETDQLDAITVLNVANPSTVASSTTGTPPNQIQVALKQEGAGANDSAVSLLGGRTIAYNLCGIVANNSSCSIGSGTPTTNETLLLRREALELSLYTFRYLPFVENVVAVLPPGSTQQSSTLSPTPPTTTATTQPLDLAVLFDRQQLEPFVQPPTGGSLSDTLPLQYPPTVSELSLWRQTQDAANVDELTAHAIFSDQFEHAEDGSYLLVLNPLPPQ